MRVVCGVVLKCLACVLAAFALFTATASAEGVSALGGTGGSPLESPLVVPEGLPLTGSQSVEDAEEAQRASPEAVLSCQQSQTKYEGLGAEEAGRLAAEVFPGVVGEPAGGPPRLPAGQSITGFPSVDVAQVDLGGGKRGVIDSTGPIAVEIAPGRRVPVDLSVSEAEGSFRVVSPVVGVGIPRRLQEGVSLAGTGVSLTPVDASGVAVGGGEGHVDGSVVFYGGVGAGSDVDELVKPERGGFSEDAILRSVLSPGTALFPGGVAGRRESCSGVGWVGRCGGR